MGEQFSHLRLIEECIREMMNQRKSKKARKSAPSEWTESLGFSSNPLGYKYFNKEAPFSKKKAFCDSNFRCEKKRELFFMICEALQHSHPKFAEIFKVAGRVDLKYNSTICEEDHHFDAKDACHQVFFTFGHSNQKLCVEEGTTVTKISGFFSPTAFDGRFKHWVEEREKTGVPLGVNDRISVICYLVDVPEYYKHKKMTTAELKTHLEDTE